MLVITPRPDDARRLHDHLLTYLGEDCPALLLPEPEVLPYERLAVDANTSNQRLSALASLAGANGRGDTPSDDPLVVCSVGSALLYTLAPSLVSGTASGPGEPGLLRVGDHVRVNDLLAQWLDLGYRNEPVVESPGSFSHRGGILDLFPATADLPLRIELFDNEIDTIRAFDPFTQRSIRPVQEVRLVPAREQLPGLADAERGRRPHHRHGLHPLQLRNQRQDAGRAAEPGVGPQPGDPLVLQRVGERGPPAGLPGPHEQRGPGAPRTDRGRGVGAGGKVRPDAAGPGGKRRTAGQLPIALHDLGPIRPAPDSSAQG